MLPERPQSKTRWGAISASAMPSRGCTGSGPRALLEMLSEFGAKRMCRFELEEMVGRYAELDAEVVRALGVDRMPPAPVPPPRLVER